MDADVLTVLNLLADDKEIIAYRKRLNQLTGSVTASILLQQIIYWSKIAGFKPFFKFKAPCKHSWYKEGDSWTEELGFSSAEFDTAIKKIGTKITKGMSKSQEYQGTTPQHLVIYWTDSSRISWYHLNADLLGKSIISIYLENQESGFTNKDDNPDLPSSETTTETTTDIDFDSLQQASKNDNLPTAHDGHQRAIDQANGGGDLDPNEEVAKHHYWGLMGGPVPLPTGKREYKKWYETGKTILNRLPQPWDLERILAIIDQLWETEWDAFYQRMPCKEEAVDIFVSKIVRQLQNGHGFTPTPADQVQARLDAEPAEIDPLVAEWGELLPLIIDQFGALRGSQLLGRDNGSLKVLVKSPHAGVMDHLDRGRGVIKRALGVEDIEFVREADA